MALLIENGVKEATRLRLGDQILEGTARLLRCSLLVALSAGSQLPCHEGTHPCGESQARKLRLFALSSGGCQEAELAATAKSLGELSPYLDPPNQRGEQPRIFEPQRL